MNHDLAVIAIDPGKNTGIATYGYSPVGHLKGTGTHLDPMYAVASNSFNSSIMSAEDAMTFVYGFLKVVAYSNVKVVCERYTITTRTAKLTQQYDALEVIGAVKLACLLTHTHPPELIPPATSKKFGNTETLRKIGWYQPVQQGMDHHNDAASLIVAYIATTYPDLLKTIGAVE